MWIIRSNNSYLLASPTPTPTLSITPTNTVTPTVSLTNTETPKVSQTNTVTPTNTATPTITPTNTVTPTNTFSPTVTNTPTNTLTSSITVTPTITYSNTATPTVTNSSTPTLTVTNTPTNSLTVTNTPTSTYNYPGVGINAANYNYGADWADNDGNVTTIGTNGGPSSYGTYDQCGNVWEWNEGISFTTNRGIRGGSWRNVANFLKSNYSNSTIPTNEYYNIGFRIASINNPNNLNQYAFIGNINNDPDPSTGYGSVSYTYMLGRYLITNSEYVEFLNAVASTADQYGLYNSLMSSDSRGGITRTLNGSIYTYSIKPYPLPVSPATAMSNKPVTFISWFDAARYCNWLHNNKASGLQTASTTEDGAYTLNGTNSGTSINRNINAKYFIPTESEWYKAAFYDKNTGLYWIYATQNTIDPTIVSANLAGDGVIS
jgi:formylglycine-generating enzyme required for sulfatase activity